MGERDKLRRLWHRSGDDRRGLDTVSSIVILPGPSINGQESHLGDITVDHYGNRAYEALRKEKPELAEKYESLLAQEAIGKGKRQ